jgi:hypothetical protein
LGRFGSTSRGTESFTPKIVAKRERRLSGVDDHHSYIKRLTAPLDHGGAK